MDNRSQTMFTMQEWESTAVRETKRERIQIYKRGKRQAFTDPEEQEWLELGHYAVAMHKGTLVALKKIHKKHVDIIRPVLKEIKTVLKIRICLYSKLELLKKQYVS